MKKRVAGGVVLVAVGIGIWLSNLFNGLGPGGAGTNVGMNPEVSVNVNPGESSGGTMPEPDTESPVGIAVTGPPVVVIDGQEFFLEQRTGETTRYLPASLKQIVEMATNAQPDEDGIRVQIKRRGSARHSAEAALDTALREAGLTEEQIQRHAGFVE